MSVAESRPSVAPPSAAPAPTPQPQPQQQQQPTSDARSDEQDSKEATPRHPIIIKDAGDTRSSPLVCVPSSKVSVSPSPLPPPITASTRDSAQPMQVNRVHMQSSPPLHAPTIGMPSGMFAPPPQQQPPPGGFHLIHTVGPPRFALAHPAVNATLGQQTFFGGHSANAMTHHYQQQQQQHQQQHQASMMGMMHLLHPQSAGGPSIQSLQPQMAYPPNVFHPMQPTFFPSVPQMQQMPFAMHPPLPGMFATQPPPRPLRPTLRIQEAATTTMTGGDSNTTQPEWNNFGGQMQMQSNLPAHGMPMETIVKSDAAGPPSSSGVAPAAAEATSSIDPSTKTTGHHLSSSEARYASPLVPMPPQMPVSRTPVKSEMKQPDLPSADQQRDAPQHEDRLDASLQSMHDTATTPTLFHSGPSFSFPPSIPAASAVFAAAAAATAATEAELGTLGTVDPSRLHEEIHHLHLINRQLEMRYVHVKHSFASLHDLLSHDLNDPDHEPPQIVFAMHQMMEETLARDAQLREIGATADADPGATNPSEPRSHKYVDPVQQLAGMQMQGDADEAARTDRARGRQRGKPMPVHSLKESASVRRKRESRAVETAAAAAAPPPAAAPPLIATAPDTGGLGLDAASETAIFSLSSLASLPGAAPTRARSPPVVDKKSLIHYTSKPRQDAVAHAYGTRRTNRSVKFILEPSPSPETETDTEEERERERDRRREKDRPADVVAAEDADGSEDYDELDAAEEGSSEEDELNEVEDEEFVASRPRHRVRHRGKSVSSHPSSSSSTSPSSKKRVALPGHHAMTSISTKISRYPLLTIFVKVQKMWTEGKDEAKRMTPAEQTSLVLVPIRFMVVNPQHRQAAGRLNNSDIFVIAKDISVLIHKRKGSVAKSIYNFEDSEKVRIHVCSRPREAGRGSGVVGGGGSISGGGASTTGLSTQVLTVLSYRGVQRLMKHSRSSLASHVQKWVQEQYRSIIENESLLREHKARSARMDRLKHLPSSQQKPEEARILRMDEEEEMDVYEGFEHLSTTRDEPEEEEEEEDVADSESIRDQAADTDTNSVATSEADMEAASSHAATSAATSPSHGAPSPRVVTRSKPSKKKTAPARKRPKPSGTAASHQSYNKRVKTEAGIGHTESAGPAKETPMSEEEKHPSAPSSAKSEPRTNSPGLTMSLLRRRASMPPAPPAQTSSPSSSTRSHRVSHSAARSLFPGGVEVPVDPDVYQAEAVPEEGLTPPVAVMPTIPRVPPPYAFPTPSPYISVPVPAQISSAPNEQMMPLPPTSATLAQVMQSQHSSMMTKEFLHADRTALKDETTSAPSSAATSPVNRPRSEIVSAPSSPMNQMDTFASVEMPLPTSKRVTDACEPLTPHIASTNTSPLFASTPHPDIDARAEDGHSKHEPSQRTNEQTVM